MKLMRLNWFKLQEKLRNIEENEIKEKNIPKS